MSDITDNEELDEVPVMLLTNEPNEMKLKTLEIIYNSIASGQLGYMDGKDARTGEIVPLLVGLDPTADGKFNIFPVARLFLGVKEMPNYLVPDGSGNYYDPGIDPVECLGLSDEEEGGAPEGFDEETTVH